MSDNSIPLRRMFKSKIHRATVTHADTDYEGSVTIDTNLMEAADIIPFEEVHIWNVSRGTRLTTYALCGERDSGVICVNGAAAHLASPGDLVIIATFTELQIGRNAEYAPVVVLVNNRNEIVDSSATEVPGPDIAMRIM